MAYIAKIGGALILRFDWDELNAWACEILEKWPKQDLGAQYEMTIQFNYDGEESEAEIESIEKV